jgi:antitoxin MazE
VETRVKKWGNSLALRIPRPLANEAGLEEDSLVSLSLIEGKLLVLPVGKPEFSLEDLLARVTRENLHDEVDTGPSQGGEVW